MNEHLAVMLIVELDDEADFETTTATMRELRTAVGASVGGNVPGGRIVQAWVGIKEYADHAIQLANGQIHIPGGER